MKQGVFFVGLVVSLFVGSAFGGLWTYSGSGTWGPPSLGNLLSPGLTMTVSLEAIASESPDEIRLKIYSDTDFSTSIFPRAGDDVYRVFRKDPEAMSWGPWIGTVTGGTDVVTWVDTNIMVGVSYEYGLAATGRVFASVTEYMNANVIAGVRVDRTEAKGRMAVVVTDEVVARLPLEYGQYKEDLVLDGWTVDEIVVPRAVSYTGNGTGPNDANGVPTGPFPTNHVAIRNELISIYNAHPGELKNVVLLGKVPVARTGTGFIGPDGHGNVSATVADAYYADMDGVWTDVGSNVSSYSGGIAAAVKEGKMNVAGDYKFDADYISDLGSPNNVLELGFGRVDFSNYVGAEYESMRNYFNKLHRYKVGSPDFLPGRKALLRSTYGIVTHEYLAALPGVLGMTNVSFLTTGDLPADPPPGALDGDADAAYTRDTAPYLFYFKGSGGPGASDGSRAVFWTGMQSHWGYWFSMGISSGQTRMQRRLAEDNFTLSYTWSISTTSFPFLNYRYHRFGMGGNAGDVMRATIRHSTGTNTLYSGASSPLFLNHMGDPALRIYMFAPPTDLEVVSLGGHPALSWGASVAPSNEPPVLGYHVYRSADVGGPFVRLTSSLVGGTSYTDMTTSSGAWQYQVKAVRLEASGGGSFYNSSLAVQQGIDLTGGPALLLVDTNVVLPDAHWDTFYEVELQALGGTPQFMWSTDTNDLPAGLTLAMDGVLSGKPETNGVFSFRVFVTDALGQTNQALRTLSVSALDVQVVEAESGGYVTGNNPTYTARYYEPAMQISGSVYEDSGFLRFDLSGVHTNDSFVKAQLVLRVDGLTPSGSPIVLKGALCSDGDDGWTETGLSYSTRPADNGAFPAVSATNLVVRHEVLVLDVSSFVFETLENDVAKKLTIRLFSDTPAGFGQSLRIANRYACKLGRPQLLVQTTGTEGYEPPPPVEPPPPPETVDVFSEASDASIGLGVGSNKVVAYTAQSVLNIGDDNSTFNQGTNCAIVVFKVPDFEGRAITGATLAVDMKVSWPGGTDPFPKGVDLYGVRFSGSSAVLASDYGFKGAGPGMLIEDDVLVIPSNENTPYATIDTDVSGDAALFTWVTNQFNAGAEVGDYLFFRYELDGNTANSIQIVSADNVDGSLSHPRLTFVYASVGGSIADWRLAHFGTTNNVGPSADSANPMGDGFPNMLKYVMGLSPTNGYLDGPYVPFAQMEVVGGSGEVLTYRFTYDPSSTDVLLEVEATDDLLSDVWVVIDPFNVTNQVDVLEDTPEAGLQTITIKDLDTNTIRRILRLKASRL